MFDCHFHLEESLVSIPGLIASMDRDGIKRTNLLPNVCPPLEALSGLARTVLPLFRRGIHGRPGPLHRLMLAMYGNAVKPGGQVDLLGKRYPVKPQPDNDAPAAAAQAHPERFTWFAWVNPAGPVDPITELERVRDRPGLCGVKAHPYWHHYPTARLMDTAALCQDRGWPLLIHLGPHEQGDFRVLPENFPRLKLIHAHAGIPYSFNLRQYAGTTANVYVDFSNLEYTDFRVHQQCLAILGPEKCLFGSDGPYFHTSGDRFNYQPFIDALDALRLSDRDREKVAGKNFEDLIKPGL